MKTYIGKRVVQFDVLYEYIIFTLLHADLWHSADHQAANLLCISSEVADANMPLYFPDLVQQQGLAQHGLFPQRDEQRHPARQPEGRPRPHQVWHHCLQSPAQPHQGAAVAGRTVSITYR